MEYYNITRELNFVLSQDKKHSKKDLMNSLENALNSNGVKVLEMTPIEHSQINLIVRINEKTIKFIILLKNITGAGWSDKLHIKRVQVANIKNESPESLTYKSESVFNLIIGYYNYDGNPIFACWDAYRYINHSTIRSCYVTVDTLKRGYEKGYYEGVDSSQKIWVFTPKHIARFLINYMTYIKGQY